jgi:hypothetical protein
VNATPSSMKDLLRRPRGAWQKMDVELFWRMEADIEKGIDDFLAAPRASQHDKSPNVLWRCRSDTGIVRIAWEGDYVWISHSKGVAHFAHGSRRLVCGVSTDQMSVQLTDQFVLLIAHRLRQRGVSVRSSCGFCNEELTFRTPHACKGMHDFIELAAARLFA